MMVFFTTIGLLAYLYTLHFRRRALFLGPDRLRSALSRAMEGDETPSPDDLAEAARELERRFGRAALFSWCILALLVAACLLLTFLRAHPGPALALCGAAVFMLFTALSFRLLRELPRALLSEENDKKPDAERPGGRRPRDS